MWGGFKGPSEVLNSVNSQNPKGLEGTSGDPPGQGLLELETEEFLQVGLECLWRPHTLPGQSSSLGHPSWKEPLSHLDVKFLVV